MTLIEFMVWTVLAALVLGMLTFMLIQILRYARVESGRSHSFLAEMRSMSWLSQDLRYANSAGVVVHQADDSPTWLAIQLSSAVTSSEQAHFDDQLVFYGWRPSERVLWRYLARPPVLTLNPLAPIRPSEGELALWSSDARTQHHPLADFVTSFKLLGKDGPLPPRINGFLRIHLETTSPDGKQSFQQERLISVRFSN